MEKLFNEILKSLKQLFAALKNETKDITRWIAKICK